MLAAAYPSRFSARSRVSVPWSCDVTSTVMRMWSGLDHSPSPAKRPARARVPSGRARPLRYPPIRSPRSRYSRSSGCCCCCMHCIATHMMIAS